MFRAQQNAFDEVVAKATDENLTSVNWGDMLDVCDRATESATAPKDVVQALIKRLAHRNANVQLYTLELANSLAQNCGAEVHRELASRSFTEALLRLAGDRNTHQQVKSSIVERMAEWTKMFEGNHDLGIMEQAYNRLKQTNPNLHPPSKPNKQQITDADRRKEEEELQMALQLSIKENTVPAPAPASSNAPGRGGGGGSMSPTDQQQQQSQQQAQQQQQQPTQPVSSSGTTAATVSRVRALFDFQPSEPGELPFKKGDIIAVIESVYRDWWRGSLRGQTGIFPLNYVEKLADPTPEELAREAQMESEVFGEIKNVEKLLTLLSTSGAEGPSVRDNEEITTLYHSTLAIRPKLIELIGKYSQRKDDFTQLNEKFIKARRDYEALLDQSMSQPQPSYGRPGQPPYGQPPYGQQPQSQQPGYGQYPPNDPSRFYAPGQGPENSQTPQPQQHPPRNGPSPFYIAGQVPGGGPTPLQTGYQAGQDQSPVSGQPPNPAAADPYNRRPESTYDNPQEIGTSGYQSPTDGRPTAGPGSSQPPQGLHSYPYDDRYQSSARPPPPQSSGPPAGLNYQPRFADPPAPAPNVQGPYPGAHAPESPLSPVAPLNPSHGAHSGQPAQPDGQHQQSQAPYQQPQYGAGAPGAGPPQPSYAPPAKPSSPSQGNAYAPYQGGQQQPQQQQPPPALVAGGGGSYPGQAQYQAYQPQPGQSQPGGAAGFGGGNDPSSFYR